MLVSALKMKRATEEIISFTVSKSFYHVCRIILEYHMNIIWENLSFITYNQNSGGAWGGEKKKNRSRYANASLLNHVSCSKICRDVLRIHFWARSSGHDIGYAGLDVDFIQGQTGADAESQRMEPRQSPGAEPGPRFEQREAQTSLIQTTCALLPLSLGNKHQMALLTTLFIPS